MLKTLQRRLGSIAAAMLLHYAANLPITLAQLGWLGPNPGISQLALGVWVSVCAIGSLAFFVYSHARQTGPTPNVTIYVSPTGKVIQASPSDLPERIKTFHNTGY